METPLQLGETKRSILSLLLDGETTTEDLAHRLRMNPSVIRKHLDDMAASKLVEFSFRRDGTGRPSKVYRVSAEGRDKISAKYDEIVDVLTAAIIKDRGIEEAKRLFKSAAHVLAARVGKQRINNLLLKVLSDLGFEPQLRKDDEKDLIRSGNCPFFKLAQKYAELTCDTFHTTFLREVLDRPKITLRQTIARGAKECIHAA